MGVVKLQEISRQTIAVNKAVDTTLHWGDNPLTVHTGKGLIIYEFSKNITSFSKRIDTVTSLIKCPKTSPATKLFPREMMTHAISSSNYNQMLIETTLWPHNRELMDELAEFTSYSWSPVKFQYNNVAIIATITNIGNIEFFGRHRLVWKSVLRLSDAIEVLYANQVPKVCYPVTTKSLEETRKCALALETSAMCWGQLINNSSCHFITAQKNGDLLFWLLNVDEDLKANFVAKISLYNEEIKSIFCVHRTGSVYLIISSDIFGHLNILECEFTNTTVNVIKTNCLWNHDDRIVVNHLKYLITDKDVVILLFVKHRHLLVQKIVSTNIVTQFFHNVNENRITVFTQIGNDFYVCTENNKIYKISLNLSEDNISVNLNEIPIKDNYCGYSLYGFDVSHCGAMYTLALVDKRIRFRKEPLSVLIVFLTEVKDGTEIKILLDNPLNDVSKMWDCLELVRYKAIKARTLPKDVDYNKMYQDGDSNIYYHKLYLLFLTLCGNMEKSMWLNDKVELPEKSIEKVKEKILFYYAQSKLDVLFKSYQLNSNQLTDFEIETFVGVQKFLKYYCLKYKHNLEDFVNVDVFDTIKTRDLKQLCECCNEELTEFVCKNDHLNLFCCLTFTPITQEDYLCCNVCNALARIELKKIKPKCVFCDITMNTFSY